jgi:hypothetical protein
MKGRAFITLLERFGAAQLKPLKAPMLTIYRRSTASAASFQDR